VQHEENKIWRKIKKKLETAAIFYVIYYTFSFCFVFMAHNGETTLSQKENLRVSADCERIKMPCHSAHILALISLTTLSAAQ